MDKATDYQDEARAFELGKRINSAVTLFRNKHSTLFDLFLAFAAQFLLMVVGTSFFMIVFHDNLQKGFINSISVITTTGLFQIPESSTWSYIALGLFGIVAYPAAMASSYVQCKYSIPQRASFNGHNLWESHESLVALLFGFFFYWIVYSAALALMFDIDFESAMYKTLYLGLTFQHPFELLNYTSWLQCVLSFILMIHFLGLFAMLVSLICQKQMQFQQRTAQRCTGHLKKFWQSIAMSFRKSKKINDIELNTMIRESMEFTRELQDMKKTEFIGEEYRAEVRYSHRFAF